jgi:hypothetical protein
MRTPEEVVNFLNEQGYPSLRCIPEEAQNYALYLDMPDGLETTREGYAQRMSALIDKIEALEAPFIHFGCWPNGSRAALAVSGDIDSVTVQDFFMRVIEVSQVK